LVLLLFSVAKLDFLVAIMDLRCGDWGSSIIIELDDDEQEEAYNK
jgi:hypothetical protein